MIINLVSFQLLHQLKIPTFELPSEEEGQYADKNGKVERYEIYLKTLPAKMPALEDSRKNPLFWNSARRFKNVHHFNWDSGVKIPKFCLLPRVCLFCCFVCRANKQTDFKSENSHPAFLLLLLLVIRSSFLSDRLWTSTCLQWWSAYLWWWSSYIWWLSSRANPTIRALTSPTPHRFNFNSLQDPCCWKTHMLIFVISDFCHHFFLHRTNILCWLFEVSLLAMIINSFHHYYRR